MDDGLFITNNDIYQTDIRITAAKHSPTPSH
jgi:hypothetical protein